MLVEEPQPTSAIDATKTRRDLFMIAA